MSVAVHTLHQGLVSLKCWSAFNFAMTPPQWFMQDENVACHDLGKVSLERAVGY